MIGGNGGLPDSVKYNDLSWLMPAVNVESVLERLGSVIDSSSPDEVRASCPDHHLFTGKKPSGTDWSVNKHTGRTFCFTEGRGSNLLWTVVRILKTKPEEAVKFLTGGQGLSGEEDIAIAIVKNRLTQMRSRGKSEEVQQPEWVAEVLEEIENRSGTQALYDYFMSPPAKSPTNIRPATVDRYKVLHRRWGRYYERAIVPFFMSGSLVGFVAIDLYGKAAWVRNNPTKTEEKYCKTLYPAGFKSGECLFGFDDCRRNAPFLIVAEGAREVMKLWQEGFTDSVAILGAHLSDKQMELMASLVPCRVALMFDGDSAGRNATDKIAKKLERLFDVVKCEVPEGSDPKNLDCDGMKKVLISSGISISECDSVLSSR